MQREVYEQAIIFFEKTNSPRIHLTRLELYSYRHDYKSLYATLCDTVLFEYMYSNHCKELAYYWNETISNLSGGDKLMRFVQQLISEQIINNDHLDILCDFCRFCIDWMGNGEVGLIVANKAYAECKSRKGDTHKLTLFAAYHAAMSCILTGDYEGAVDLMNKEILNETINGLSECHMIKGLALALMHNYKDSHLSFFIAQETIADIYGERSWMMARCLLYEGISYLLDHNKKAINILAKAQSIVFDEYGENNFLYADISLALATYFYQIGKYEEATIGCTEAYSSYTIRLHDNNIRIAVACIIAGKISQSTKQFEEAKDLFEGAYKIMKMNNISVKIQNNYKSIINAL